MTLKKGSKGELVKTLQSFLKIEVDGDFGDKTEEAVKKWQKEHGLEVDGIVGPITWSLMGIATTDNSERMVNISTQLDIKMNYLPRGQYFDGPTTKEWLFLHHTAGWHNPYNVIADWGKDDRGAIATEFVIGGQSIMANDNRFDGEVLQAFPEGGYAWHLGIGNNDTHIKSVGIEVCSFGQLTPDGYYKTIDNKQVWIPLTKGKFYSYVGGEVAASQIVELPKAFRDYTYWHRYSDKQLVSLKELILYIANRDSIDIRKGLPELIKQKGADAFDFCDVKYVSKNKGLWCHSNVISSKVDMFPQQELIDMLLSI